MKRAFSLRPNQIKIEPAKVMSFTINSFKLKKPELAMTRADVLQSLKFAMINHPPLRGLEEDDFDFISKAADNKVLSSPIYLFVKIKTPLQSQNLMRITRLIDQSNLTVKMGVTVRYPKNYPDYARINIMRNLDAFASVIGVDDSIETSNQIDKQEVVDRMIKDIFDKLNLFAKFDWSGKQLDLSLGKKNMKNKKLIADLESAEVDVEDMYPDYTVTWNE